MVDGHLDYGGILTKNRGDITSTIEAPELTPTFPNFHATQVEERLILDTLNVHWPLCTWLRSGTHDQSVVLLSPSATKNPHCREADSHSLIEPQTLNALWSSMVARKQWYRLRYRPRHLPEALSKEVFTVKLHSQQGCQRRALEI
ncbi:hypothetical protein TNCV_1929211 [Trichonephila clavipes]|nr:hypothetical protein TNCV_1929211 [Trichonephila clavipes]